MRETLVRSEATEVFPESKDGGTKSGLTFAR